VTFTFKYDRLGRRRRIVFEKRLEAASGTTRLVVRHVDGAFGTLRWDAPMRTRSPRGCDPTTRPATGARKTAGTVESERNAQFARAKT
jgi:hypothetical protein